MEKLPSNWKRTTLGEVAQWGSGGTPNRSIAEYYGGSIPWFKTGELNEGVVTEAEEFLTIEGLKNSSAKLFPKGSIMIAMYGATIGKCAILGVEGSTNQACAVAKPNKGIDAKYLFHYLRSQKQNFIEKGKGGAQPNISQTVIKEHPFPFPPLPEQRRMVAKLDTLFAHLDQLKVRLEKIPTLLKQFRQAVLTQAVTGKLTEEWREESKVFSFDGFLNSEATSNFYEDQFEVREWVWATVSQVAEMISGYAFKSNEFVNQGIQLIRMGNLFGDKLDLDRNPAFLPKTIDKKLLEKYTVKANDILITLTGTKYKRDYGYAVLVERLQNDVLLNQRILSLRPVIDSRFFLYLMRSDIFREQFFSFETGGVNQGNVGTRAVASIVLPIPPLKEQQIIAQRVESLFALANRIEASYQSLQEKIDHLPQAILSKAFRGELVGNELKEYSQETDTLLLAAEP